MVDFIVKQAILDQSREMKDMISKRVSIGIYIYIQYLVLLRCGFWIFATCCKWRYELSVSKFRTSHGAEDYLLLVDSNVLLNWKEPYH